MNQLTRCDRLIQIRAPEFLTKALDQAADSRLTSRSDYIRVALLDRLRADGFDRLLDVMQAQGRRPAVNSATSFNTQILGDLKGGGVANNAVQIAAGGGVKLPQKTMEALQRWNIGRNLDQLSSLFTAPEAAQRFRQLALAPAGSTQAVSSILRLTNLARDHSNINNPLRASAGDKAN
jgi:hypothetical protein